MKYLRVGLLVLLAGLASVAVARNGTGTDKAKRYLTVLLRKPESGYSFDRFYQAWLETRGPGSLQTYLLKQFDSSDNPVYLLLLAYLNEKEGEDERALVNYERYLEKRPKDAGVRYDQARLQFYAGDFPAAIAGLEAALKLKPDAELELKIRKLLGRTLVREGKQKEGLKVWLEYVKNRKGDNLLTDEVIDLMQTEGLFSQAAELCRKEIGKTTNHFRIFLLTMKLGDLLRRQDKTEEALKAYTKALSLVAGDSWQEKEVSTRIEQLFQGRNDPGGLLNTFRKLTDKFPGRIELRKRLIRRLWDAGKQQEALQLLAGLLKKAPLDRGLRMQYASLLAKAGNYDDAVKILRQLQKKEPQATDIPRKIAFLEYDFKHPDRAAAALRKYLELSGKTENAYLEVGKQLAIWDMPKEAEQLYAAAVKAFPESFRVAESRAAFLYGTGKKAQALDEFKRLAVKANADQLIQLCRILQMVNQRAAALEVMELRAKDFATDFRFQEEMFYLALNRKKYSAALAAAKRMTALASTFAELSRAVPDTVYAAEKEKQLPGLIAELEKRTAPGCNERCLLAWLYEEDGNQEKAMKLLDSGLLKAPDDEILLRWKLRILIFRKDWKTATKVLENLVRSRTRKSFYLRELVNVCIKAGKYDQALKWVAEWRKLNPAATEPVMVEAEIYRDQRNMEKLTEVLRKATYRFPDNHEIAEGLVRAYLNQNRRAEAIKVYWKLLGESKSMTSKLSFVRRMALVASYGDEKEKLVRRFQALAEKNSKSIFPLLALAAIARTQQQYDLCRKYLMQAFEIKGNNLTLLMEIAELAEEQGDFDQAEALLKRLVKLDASGAYRKQLIKFYFRNGEDERGFKLMFDSLEKKAMTANEVRDVAESLVISHRAEEAVKFLEVQLEKFPNNYRLRYLYAMALDGAGKPELAVDQYLVLLRQRREMRGAKPPPGAYSRGRILARYIKIYGNAVPKEAVEVLELRNLYYQIRNSMNMAYNRRYMSSLHSFMYSGYGGYGGGLMLPYNLNSLRKFCLCQLFMLGEKLPAKEQKKLISELSSQGIKYAGVMIKAGFEQTRKNPQLWRNLLKQHPADPVVISLWMVFNFGGVPEPDEIVRTFRELKRKDPELALLVLQRGVSRLAAGNPKIISEGLELLKAVKNPPDNLLLGFMSVLTMPKINQKVKKEFLEFYRKLYANPETKPNIRNRMFYSLMVPAIQMKDWKTGRELVENILSAKSTAGGMPFYGGYSGSSTICGYPLYHSGGKAYPLILMFPPQYLKNFPQALLFVFNPNRGGRIARINPDREELWKAMKDIKNPVFHLLLADFCKKQAEGKACAKKLLSASNPDPDHMLFAAAWSGKNGYPAEAYDILKRLAKLDKTRRHRKKIYGAMLNYAVAVKDKKTSAKLVAECLTELKKQRLSNTGKAQLAAYLFNCGLADQAQEFIPAATAPATVRIIPGGFNPRGNIQNQFQKIRRMLEAGDSKKAIQMAERELRKYVNQQATLATGMNPGYSYSHENQIREMFRQIQRAGVGAEFLKVMREKAGSNQRGLLACAYACEKLGKTERGGTGLPEGLKKLVPEPVCELPAGHADFRTPSRKRLANYFIRYISKNFDHAATQLSNSFHQQNEFSRKMRYVRLFTMLLEKLASDKSANMRNLHIVDAFFPVSGAAAAFRRQQFLSVVHLKKQTPAGWRQREIRERSQGTVSAHGQRLRENPATCEDRLQTQIETAQA